MTASRTGAGHANAAARNLREAARHAAYAAAQAAAVAHVAAHELGAAAYAINRRTVGWTKSMPLILLALQAILLVAVLVLLALPKR